MDRKNTMNQIQNTILDVLVIGGGVTGASSFKELTRSGYKTLVIDKGDFASGTSQASSMMIWGGLLYLKNFDLRSVFKFSKSRDRSIATSTKEVVARPIYYIRDKNGERSSILVYLALILYWILSLFRREKPMATDQCQELSLFKKGKHHQKIFRFEEGFLAESDATFVNRRVEVSSSDCNALNYCEFVDKSAIQNGWRVTLFDRITNTSFEVECRVIINAAGVWADRINASAGISTPYKHILSKGVSINFERHPSHQNPLVFDMGEQGDTLCLLPFGPTAMWGPTETRLDQIEEGYSPSSDDIDWLLKKYNEHFQDSKTVDDIVAVRTGIRPLAVSRTKSNFQYTLQLSRRSIVHAQRDCSWITIFGGKITGSEDTGKLVLKKVIAIIGETKHTRKPERAESIRTEVILGFKVTAVDWARDHSHCLTLDDFLRRRTNLAQWIPNGGFGRGFENEDALKRIALILSHHCEDKADQMLRNYRSKLIHQSNSRQTERERKTV